MEATGKHHRAAHRRLHEAGFPVTVVNALRARLFAESLGMLVKTDSVDARMLSIFGQMAKLKTTPPLPEALENLREIVRSRDAAVAARTALVNLMGTATVACVKLASKRQGKAAREAAKTLAGPRPSPPSRPIRALPAGS